MLLPRCDAAVVVVVSPRAVALDGMGLGDWGHVLLDEGGDFFQGWNPLPTAASASGGGDLLESLLHCAASIANGVPRRLGCSCNEETAHGGGRDRNRERIISICLSKWA